MYINYNFIISMQNVRVHSEAVLTVHPVETAKSSMYYILQAWKKDLPHVMIKVRILWYDIIMVENHWKLRSEFDITVLACKFIVSFKTLYSLVAMYNNYSSLMKCHMQDMGIH